ncbi:unnamed protein product [Acanthoscelides obtectus]|uniref:Transposase n=1 Tax=Acanthoscelides obtectus TaxID=200917 RepID=A0A9P0QG00_ACAOB|nr:unnamed protein product [Acanthoscelides obtectus]CAK1689254.1 hypothetical protein AOBTE_LOCUS37120 [Acanthoscelides obtectus]
MQPSTDANRIDENPSTSTRDVAREVQVSKTKVWQTLREEGLHPFHVQRVQALKPDDFPARVRFCEWLLHQHDINPDFLKCILVTDESTFTHFLRNILPSLLEDVPLSVRQLITVSGDESWIYCEEKPTKVIRSRSVSKKMVATFGSKAGHIATIPLNEQRTVSGDWYTTICWPKVITELRKINPERRIIPHQTMQARTQLKNKASPDEAVDAFKNAWNKCFENWFERVQMCLRGKTIKSFKTTYRVVLFPYAKLKRHPSYGKICPTRRRF